MLGMGCLCWVGDFEGGGREDCGWESKRGRRGGGDGESGFVWTGLSCCKESSRDGRDGGLDPRVLESHGRSIGIWKIN